MKPSVIVILLFSLTFTLCACESRSKTKFANTSLDTTTKTTKVSLGELTKRYKSLEGQYIETEGTVWYEFENVSICPFKGALTSEPKKCFWLDFHNDLNLDDSLMEQVSGKTFIIKGKVDTSNKGHFGGYLATLKNIYFIQQK